MAADMSVLYTYLIGYILMLVLGTGFALYSARLLQTPRSKHLGNVFRDLTFVGAGAAAYGLSGIWIVLSTTQPDNPGLRLVQIVFVYFIAVSLREVHSVSITDVKKNFTELRLIEVTMFFVFASGGVGVYVYGHEELLHIAYGLAAAVILLHGFVNAGAVLSKSSLRGTTIHGLTENLVLVFAFSGVATVLGAVSFTGFHEAFSSLLGLEIILVDTVKAALLIITSALMMPLSLRLRILSK